jgi:C4-dicarboxylate transporter DctM subunit
MPLLILGGIYTGIYTVTEAASVAAIYAIIAELVFFRQMKVKDIVNTLHESVLILGIIFIIIAMATVFNYFLTIQDVPFALVEWMEGMVSSKYTFIVMTIILLLIVGLFMDVISAILIIAPLLFPTAMLYGVDPVHLGIIFILGLEIGYLTPPIGINLFVATGLFNKPFSKVVASSLPFACCLVVALLLVAFFPQIALFLTEFVE